MSGSVRTPPPPAGAADVGLDARLGEVLALLARDLRREIRLPIGASSIAALATLVDGGPRRLGDLAAHEGVTPATLSRIVAVLEQDGLAERSTDPADRRSSFLAATAAGVVLVDDVRAARAAAVGRRAASLTAGQRAALVAALPALEALVGAG